MDKAEVIAVLQKCKPLYAKFCVALKYQPTPQEEEYLKKLKQIFDAGWLDQLDLIQEARLEDMELAFLLGYVFAYSKFTTTSSTD